MASTEITYRCFSKAVKGADAKTGHSAQWSGSKRASFTVYEDKIACGPWVIPLNEIKSATLFKTKQWFLPGKVLKIITTTDSYQFGFNAWSNPAELINIPISERRMRLGFPTYSILSKLALVGVAIAYFAI